VKREFGDDNFTIAKEFITFFVRGARCAASSLFAHIDAGNLLDSFVPFGSPAEADKMLGTLREISNQRTACVIQTTISQLAAVSVTQSQSSSSKNKQRATIDCSYPDTPKKGTSRRDKKADAKRKRGGDSRSMPSPQQPEKPRASGDSPGHTDRLDRDRASRAGIKAVRDFVKSVDFADKRKAKGEPVA
jgi:hypothetical protein